MVVLLACCGVVALAAESLTVTGDGSNSWEVVQSDVLKVYSTRSGEYRFIAYVVKWKDAEVVVTDPLGKSDYKVGDKITFLAQKITIEKKHEMPITSLSFTLRNLLDK